MFLRLSCDVNDDSIPSAVKRVGISRVVEIQEDILVLKNCNEHSVDAKGEVFRVYLVLARRKRNS